MVLVQVSEGKYFSLVKIIYLISDMTDCFYVCIKEALCQDIRDWSICFEFSLYDYLKLRLEGEE